LSNDLANFAVAFLRVNMFALRMASVVSNLWSCPRFDAAQTRRPKFYIERQPRRPKSKIGMTDIYLFIQLTMTRIVPNNEVGLQMKWNSITGSVNFRL
jgi:hypothetical protein